MNTRWRDKLQRYLTENKFKLFTTAAFMLAGIILGAVWACRAGGNTAESDISDFISAYKLMGASSTDILRRSLPLNLRIFILIWISGWFVWLLPVNFVELSSKGFGFGYTISYLVLRNSIKGFLIAFSALFLQNLILIPAMLMYSVIQMNFAVRFKRLRGSGALYKQRRKLIIKNILTLCIMLLIAVLCSYIDAYIAPLLIKIFCGGLI